MASLKKIALAAGLSTLATASIAQDAPSFDKEILKDLGNQCHVSSTGEIDFDMSCAQSAAESTLGYFEEYIKPVYERMVDELSGSPFASAGAQRVLTDLGNICKQYQDAEDITSENFLQLSRDCLNKIYSYETRVNQGFALSGVPNTYQTYDSDYLESNEHFNSLSMLFICVDDAARKFCPSVADELRAGENTLPRFDDI